MPFLRGYLNKTYYIGFAFHKAEHVVTDRLRTENKYDFGKWIHLLVLQKADAEVPSCKWLDF